MAHEYEALSTLLQAGLHKADILCILDTRQIDPHKTARLQGKRMILKAGAKACIT